MNENKTFYILFKIVIEISSYPMDRSHLKEIVLIIETKWFIVENGHSTYILNILNVISCGEGVSIIIRAHRLILPRILQILVTPLV